MRVGEVVNGGSEDVVVLSLSVSVVVAVTVASAMLASILLFVALRVSCGQQKPLFGRVSVALMGFTGLMNEKRDWLVQL